MLEQMIEHGLPVIVSTLELFGIFVVTFTSVRSFIHYLALQFGHNAKYNIKYELASGLATGLEFKMAAEILKTVLVHTVDELMILGAIILLRALLSFMIHIEMRAENKEHKD